MDAPVLLIAFNRPERLKRLIASIEPHRPPKVRIAIDGPRQNVESDFELVNATRLEADNINWTDDVIVHSHSHNLGITDAIPWAVSWILTEFEHAIIIEDDVTIGPDFLNFMNRALQIWESDRSTFAISGYNLVPENFISDASSPTRYSALAHSYAWGTWRRAWDAYDPNMEWIRQHSTFSISKELGSIFFAIRWKQLCRHVRYNRVTTWDYQWVTSIWKHGGRTVMPNKNLITYHGISEGTHTSGRRSWQELPEEPIDSHQLSLRDEQIDHAADHFIHRKGHRATPLGVIFGLFEPLLIWISRKGEQFSNSN